MARARRSGKRPPWAMPKREHPCRGDDAPPVPPLAPVKPPPAGELRPEHQRLPVLHHRGADAAPRPRPHHLRRGREGLRARPEDRRGRQRPREAREGRHHPRRAAVSAAPQGTQAPAPALAAVGAITSMTKKKPPYRAGFVAIVGRPNVGKSTLLNRILGEHLAIVSPRPQTTRT